VWVQVEGGVTAAKGFKAAGIYGGLRAKGQKPDLALVACDVDATVAGKSTRYHTGFLHWRSLSSRNLLLLYAYTYAECCSFGNSCIFSMADFSIPNHKEILLLYVH
jgi:hypothetical protein